MATNAIKGQQNETGEKQMNYSSTVMTLAHRIYRAGGHTWSSALTEAHVVTKARFARDAMTANRNVIRLDRMRRRTAPVGDVLTRAFDEMGFAA